VTLSFVLRLKSQTKLRA